MEEKHFPEHNDEHVEFLPVEWRSKLTLDGGGCWECQTNLWGRGALWFRHVRNNLMLEVSLMALNAVIVPHITYCVFCWSQASETTPLISSYNQALEVLDKTHFNGITAFSANTQC